MYILSQIFIVIADIFYVFSMFSKKRLPLLLFLLLSDLFCSAHYLLLGKPTGGIIIFIDSAFLVVTYLIERFGNKKYTPIAIACAITATILTCIFTWSGPITLLPVCAMTIYLSGLLFQNIIIVKSCTICRTTLNLIYMFLIASYFGGALSIALVIFAVIGIIINFKDKKKQTDVTDVPKYKHPLRQQ